MFKKAIVCLTLLNAIGNLNASDLEVCYDAVKAGTSARQFATKLISGIGKVGTFNFNNNGWISEEIQKQNINAVVKFTQDPQFAFAHLQKLLERDLINLKSALSASTIKYTVNVLDMQSDDICPTYLVLLFNPSLFTMQKKDLPFAAFDTLQWSAKPRRNSSGLQSKRYIHATFLQNQTKGMLHVVSAYLKQGSSPESIRSSLQQLSHDETWLIGGDFTCDIRGTQTPNSSIFVNLDGAVFEQKRMTVEGILYKKAISFKLINQSIHSRVNSLLTSNYISFENVTVLSTIAPETQPDVLDSILTKDLTWSDVFAISQMPFESQWEAYEQKVALKLNHHLGSDSAHPFRLIEGFSLEEKHHRWTEGQRAKLEVRRDNLLSPKRRPHRITFEGTQCHTPLGHTQKVTVTLNGSPIKQLVYDDKENYHTIEVELPRDLSTATLGFETPDALSCDDPRVLGILLRNVVITTVPFVE